MPEHDEHRPEENELPEIDIDLQSILDEHQERQATLIQYGDMVNLIREKRYDASLKVGKESDPTKFSADYKAKQVLEDAAQAAILRKLQEPEVIAEATRIFEQLGWNTSILNEQSTGIDEQPVVDLLSFGHPVGLEHKEAVDNKPSRVNIFRYELNRGQESPQQQMIVKKYLGTASAGSRHSDFMYDLDTHTASDQEVKAIAEFIEIVQPALMDLYEELS